MKLKKFMFIAGEPSGDLLGAELVEALRRQIGRVELLPTDDFQPLYSTLEPRLFGAGGPSMAKAGVKLAFDMTAHSVIGLSDVLKNLLKFRRLFRQLFELALEREPDAIVCVDFSEFNSRFAQAIKRHVRARSGWFHDWNPKLIRYVSPQVWASREGRAFQVARDYDLLLSILPFEKEWYAQRVPQLQVEFVGHPIVERYASILASSRPTDSQAGRVWHSTEPIPAVLLLPGSRAGELTRHLPIMLGALDNLRASIPKLRARMVLPKQELLQQAKSFGLPAELEVQCGSLPQALMASDIAIASTGTVTLECALFGLPTVALYKTSWSTYQVGKRLVKVNYLAMPNILANEPLFPEFIQHAATPANIARAALQLLQNDDRRAKVKQRLAEVAASLGPPGASERAAQAILHLLGIQSTQSGYAAQS